jgi:hypothetical protein
VLIKLRLLFNYWLPVSNAVLFLCIISFSIASSRFPNKKSKKPRKSSLKAKKSLFRYETNHSRIRSSCCLNQSNQFVSFSFSLWVVRGRLFILFLLIFVLCSVSYSVRFFVCRFLGRLISPVGLSVSIHWLASLVFSDVVSAYCVRFWRIFLYCCFSVISTLSRNYSTSFANSFYCFRLIKSLDYRQNDCSHSNQIARTVFGKDFPLNSCDYWCSCSDFCFSYKRLGSIRRTFISEASLWKATKTLWSARLLAIPLKVFALRLFLFLIF